uniref:GST C-terminal domain-containing protein n=1 Tax=Aegilops tauschii subsp. strangulata TaxID=200361 RepID=A0A453QV09_AEGTS
GPSASRWSSCSTSTRPLAGRPSSPPTPTNAPSPASGQLSSWTRCLITGYTMHYCVITLWMMKFSRVGDVNICMLASYVQLVAPWQKVFTTKTEEEKAEWMEQTLAAVDVLEGGLKECSKGGSFFGGDNVGYVDVVLGGAVPWIYGTEALCGTRLFDTSRVPLLAAWLERFGALDVAKAVMADVPTRLVELAKMKRAEAAAGAAASLPFDC